jgi:molybdate transport system ATP-binding protein
MLEVQIYKKLAEFDLDVSFQVNDNILGLMGASGSGKSMTLKCIAGIETPDQGRIVLNDRVLFDSEKKINVPIQKRNVGYMFQSYALFPNMNVYENINDILAGLVGYFAMSFIFLLVVAIIELIKSIFKKK